MTQRTGVNYPLLRDLKEMGLLTNESVPKWVGPFKIQSECFVGDTSGATKTLAQTPLSGGIFSCATIATAAGTANTLTQLVLDTNYSVSGTTLTYLADYSAHQVFIQYAY